MGHLQQQQQQQQQRNQQTTNNEQQTNNKMVFYSTTLLLAFLCSAQALPTTDLARPDPTENAVNVDQKPEKEVNLENEENVKEEQERILGSQFAVAFTHPERKGLVTGHRIPLGLFPVETQNRILGLPTTSAEAEEDKYVSSSSFRRVARLAIVGHLPSRHLQPPALPTAPNALNTETLQKASLSESAGVPSRQLTPPSLPPVASFARDVLPRDNSLSAFGHLSFLEGQEREGDKAYDASLRTFLSPSFF